MGISCMEKADPLGDTQPPCGSSRGCVTWHCLWGWHPHPAPEPCATCLVTLLWPNQPLPWATPGGRQWEAEPALPPGGMWTHSQLWDPHRSLQKSIGKQQDETKNLLLSFIKTTATYLGCSRHDSALIIFIELEIRLQYSQIIALLALYYSFNIIYLH